MEGLIGMEYQCLMFNWYGVSNLQIYGDLPMLGNGRLLRVKLRAYMFRLF